MMDEAPITHADLWRAQLHFWPQSVQLTPREVLEWAARGATSGDQLRRFRMISMAIQFPTHVWYLTRPPVANGEPTGTNGLYMGCRYGLEGPDYLSGFDYV